MAPPTSKKEKKKEQQKIAQKDESFRLEILKITKEAQSQHGLAFRDYARYQSYCSKRIARIRKSLHFTNGRGKLFQKKAVQLSDITDPKFLLLVLMQAERKWALALNLKEISSSTNEYASRARHHMVNALKRAVQFGNQLVEFSEKKADKESQLEAQAYKAYLDGNLYLSESRWPEALKSFEKSTELYEQLPTFKTDYVQLCKEKINELNSNIKFCQLNSFGTLKSQQPKQQSTQQSQANVLNEIDWKGKKIQITNEKIKFFLSKAQTSLTEIEKSEDSAAKVQLFDDVFISFGDALTVVKDELLNLVSKKVQGNKENLDNLLKYIEYSQLSKTCERNLLLLQNLQKNFQKRIPKSEKKTQKQTKAEDLAKMYENLIQLKLDLVSKFGEEDTTALWKANRCYYLSLVYIRNKKWNEALALLQRGEHYLVQVPDKESIKEVQAKINGEKYEIHAKAFLASQSEKKQNSQEFNGLLLDNLNCFSTTFADNKRVAEFPPNFAAIRCKPQLFDLALEQVESPQIDSTPQTAQSGSQPERSPLNPPKPTDPDSSSSSGGLMSWFGWGKKE